MYAYAKKFLGTSASKVTTWLAVLVSVLGLFADSILPTIAPFIDQLSPGKALAIGAAITWIGRVRGILKEVNDGLQAP